jgi:hypothetical protein
LKKEENKEEKKIPRKDQGNLLNIPYSLAANDGL